MFKFLFDIDTWQEVSDSLTKNKVRTVITMIGVWWGILLLIGLLGTILMGLATWTLVTLIELQLIVAMIQSDLMSIDKQFGRVYNFIDSVRGK